jgi:hypothetical protein
VLHLQKSNYPPLLWCLEASLRSLPYPGRYAPGRILPLPAGAWAKPAPIARLSELEPGRKWTDLPLGIDPRSLPREQSLCQAHAVSALESNCLLSFIVFNNLFVSICLTGRSSWGWSAIFFLRHFSLRHCSANPGRFSNCAPCDAYSLDSN